MGSVLCYVECSQNTITYLRNKICAFQFSFDNFHDEYKLKLNYGEMQMLYVFIATFTIYLIVPLTLRVLVYRSRIHPSSNSYMLKYPRIIPIFTFPVVIFVAFVIVWASIKETHISLSLRIFILISYNLLFIAFSWLFLRTLNWQLILEEDHMVYRNSLGIVRQINYSDIKQVKTYYSRTAKAEQYKLYTSKQRITVDFLVVNFHNFPKIMKKRLKNIKSTVQF